MNHHTSFDDIQFFRRCRRSHVVEDGGTGVSELPDRYALQKELVDLFQGLAETFGDAKVGKNQRHDRGETKDESDLWSEVPWLEEQVRQAEGDGPLCQDVEETPDGVGLIAESLGGHFRDDGVKQR